MITHLKPDILECEVKWALVNITMNKDSAIKNRNGMDLKKQKILRIGGKNTQKNYTKKVLMTS